MNLILESFKSHVGIWSDRDESWQGFDQDVLFETFLPCVSCLPAEGIDKVGAVRLVHRFSAEQRIRKKRAWSTEIHDAWVGTPPPYVYVLLEQLIERARQEQSVFSFHASSVSIDGRGVLILADNWHGKTSTAIYLALHSPGKVATNNRTILNDAHILGGSQYFDVKESFWQYFSDLRSSLSDRTVRSYDGRYTFRWPQICYDAFPLPLIAIILSHINGGAKEMKLIPRAEAIWYLFRQASFVVRGDCILFDGMVASPSYDDRALSQERLLWIRQLTEEVPLIYMSGCLEYICEQVTKLAKSEL